MNLMNAEPGSRLRFSAAHGGTILEPGHATRFVNRCKLLESERKIPFVEAVEILRLEDPSAFRLATLAYRTRETEAEAKSKSAAIELDAHAKAIVRGESVTYQAAIERLRVSRPEAFKAATAHLTLDGRR